MPVEFTPPRIAVVIDKHTFTRELVAASGAFGLCLPGTALADLAYAVGNQSGRTVDKFARHGIVAKTGPVLGVPLIELGCAAWLECRLIREPHTEDAYDTCFAEVVAAAADERIFANGHWLFRDDNLLTRALRSCRNTRQHAVLPGPTDPILPVKIEDQQLERGLDRPAQMPSRPSRAYGHCGWLRSP